MIYLRARYYNPNIGRFTSLDIEEGEISNPLDMNRYVYCRNNPIKYVDPSGESTAQGILVGGWSIGAGAATADGPFPYGDVVGGAIGVGGTILAGGVWLFEKLTKVFNEIKAKAISDAITKTAKNSDDVIIYRMGSGNATNLTPRDVDMTGLSYTTVMPTSGSFTITSIQTINETGVLMAVQDGTNHVSVKPVDVTKMQEWINSRPLALINPHRYTVLLQNISIKIK